MGPVEDVKSTETESAKVTVSKGFVDSESEEDMEASSVTGRSTKGGSALPEEALESSVNMSGARSQPGVGSMSETSMSLVSNRYCMPRGTLGGKSGLRVLVEGSLGSVTTRVEALFRRAVGWPELGAVRAAFNSLVNKLEDWSGQKVQWVQLEVEEQPATGSEAS